MSEIAPEIVMQLGKDFGIIPDRFKAGQNKKSDKLFPHGEGVPLLDHRLRNRYANNVSTAIRNGDLVVLVAFDAKRLKRINADDRQIGDALLIDSISHTTQVLDKLGKKAKFLPFRSAQAGDEYGCWVILKKGETLYERAEILKELEREKIVRVNGKGYKFSVSPAIVSMDDKHVKKLLDDFPERGIAYNIFHQMAEVADGLIKQNKVLTQIRELPWREALQRPNLESMIQLFAQEFGWDRASKGTWRLVANLTSMATDVGAGEIIKSLSGGDMSLPNLARRLGEHVGKLAKESGDIEKIPPREKMKDPIGAIDAAMQAEFGPDYERMPVGFGIRGQKIRTKDTYTDLLVRLPITTDGLKDELVEDLDSCLQEGKPAVVIFGDLDNLKMANDNFGREGANKLIRWCFAKQAKLWKQLGFNPRRNDQGGQKVKMARYGDGGDESVTLITHLTPEQITVLKGQLEELNRVRRMEIGGRIYYLSNSVAMVFSDEIQDRSPNAFTEKADLAEKKVKRIKFEHELHNLEMDRLLSPSVGPVQTIKVIVDRFGGGRNSPEGWTYLLKIIALKTKAVGMSDLQNKMAEIADAHNAENPQATGQKIEELFAQTFE